MKNIIVITALLLLSMGGMYAQTAWKYCELLVSQPGLKNFTAELRIDGSSTRQKALLRDVKGEPMKFGRAIDALNYVANQGWELVSSYCNRGGDVHFIMKRSGR